MYIKITSVLATLSEHMHKKFEVDLSKIMGAVNGKQKLLNEIFSVIYFKKCAKNVYFGMLLQHRQVLLKFNC